MAIASDSFSGVDLSRLPPPTVIEALDFESIYAQALVQFQTYFPSFDATVDQQFSATKVSKELERYRRKGAGRTARMLLDGLKKARGG